MQRTFTRSTMSHCVAVQTIQDSIYEYYEIFNVTLTAVNPTARVTISREFTDLYIQEGEEDG